MLMLLQALHGRLQFQSDVRKDEVARFTVTGACDLNWPSTSHGVRSPPHKPPLSQLGV